VGAEVSRIFLENVGFQRASTFDTAYLGILRSKIISRVAKIQVYKTLIRPVATYGAETWTLTVADENGLKMFERKTIRRWWKIMCGE
jgi:hypothetical protein